MTSISGVGATTNLFGKVSGQSENAKAELIAIPASESSKVTLSDDAKVLAGFASKGLTIAMREFNKPLTASSSNNSTGQMVTDKSISKEDFVSLLSNLGVNEADRDKLISGFDSNADGTFSHAEILKAFAGTSDSNNSLSQSILGLMDRNGNGDGRVDAREFAKLSTAFYDAEK